MYWKLLFLSLFLFASATALNAQVTTAAMDGKVLTGKEAIIGASIKVIHKPSGTIYGTISNIDGRFSLQGMRTGGPYEITVSYVGYKTAIYDNIYLQLGDAYVLNVSLSESSEIINEVIVMGMRSKFSGDKTGASTNVHNRDISMLPSINRSLSDFTRLSPYSGSGKSFAGRDGRLNNVTIDGANFNNNFGLSDNLPGGGNPISLDAIEELQVTIAPYDVRQANFVGAGINAITKSGTNTYKGTAYTYIRNEKLRGNSVDGNDLGVRDEESTKTYGFTLGGPIIKNKLFFFVNSEFEDSPGQITKYRVSSDNAPSSGLYSRTTAKNMEDFASVLRNKYDYEPGSYTNFPGGSENTKMLARIDWNINTDHKFTVRYNYTKNTNNLGPNNNSAPNPRSASYRISNQSMAFFNNCYTMTNKVQSITGELNSRFGTNVSNQLLVTFTEINDVRGSASSPFPHIDIWKDNDIFMSAGYELFSWNNEVKNNIFTVVDNYSISLGAHKLTTGISYENQYVSNSYMRYGTGYYRYASFDDFVNGAAPSAFGLTYGYGGETNPESELKFGQWATYIQDEWNINNRFKITTGIRADLTQYINDLVENKAISQLTFINNRKIDTGMWPKSRILLSPRIGFNWDVMGDKTLKVRGGTGIFTGRIPLVFFTNMPTNSGMVQNTFDTTDPAILSKLTGGVITNVEKMKTALDLPDLPAQEAPSSIAAVDEDFKLPQIWKTTLAVDYQLPVSFPMTATFEAMYSKDINAVCQENVNMINTDGLPRFGGTDDRFIYPGKKNSRIHSGISEAMVLKNSSKGYGYTLNTMITAEPVRDLNLMMAYTYTVVKEISGNPGSQAASAWSNQPSVNGPNQLGLQNSQYVTPHKVVASLTYRFPECAAWKGSSIGIYYSGYSAGSRISYTYSNDMNQDGVNNDLMYIPKSRDEIQFKEGVNGFTASEQADAFWQFVEQDSYLKNNKGKYAEAYSATTPWVNRFDVKLTKDFYINVGKNKNTLQLSFDIINFGNIIKDSWGVIKNASSCNYGKILKYEGLSNNKPIYSMNTKEIDGKKVMFSDTFEKYHHSSNCWQLQLGIRYIFN